jgi:hypothetical protein
MKILPEDPLASRFRRVAELVNARQDMEARGLVLDAMVELADRLTEAGLLKDDGRQEWEKPRKRCLKCDRLERERKAQERIRAPGSSAIGGNFGFG